MDYALERIAQWQKMPEHSKQLLSFNNPRLVKLPPIPYDCERLLFHMCDIVRFDTPFPPNLKVLVLRSCRMLKEIPKHFPDALELLVIENCPFVEEVTYDNGYVRYISTSPLNHLVYLPPSLLHLDLNGSGISTLPKQLPRTLKYLNLLETNITDLPDLPEGLESLHVEHEIVLPYLPDSLQRLYFDDYENNFEDMQYYANEVSLHHTKRIADLNVVYEWPRSKARTLSRTTLLKEELMAAAWHPRRVVKWLEAGDDIYDSMCGSE